MEELTAVSLFAGVGGFDIALERAGVKVVAAVEIDDNARGVLKHRFPNHQLFNDVCEVTGEQLRSAGFIPNNGIIVGGFPCQDLSVAGRRAGLAGERSGLFWEIVRLVDELRPRYLILENVPGLLSSNRGRDMGTVLTALADRGYGVSYRVLDAQNFGVAQRRRRVFIVASLGDNTGPVEILLEPKSCAGDPAKSAGERKAATGITEPSSDGGSWRVGNFKLYDFPKHEVAPTLAARRTKDSLAYRMQAFGQYVEDDVARAVKARDYKDATDLVVFHPHYHDGARIQGDTMNTLTSRMGTGGNNVSMVATQDAVRRLTPRECERLQGFPDEWTSHRWDYKKQTVIEQADSSRYKQMGNAVAIPCVEWIARRLVANHQLNQEGNK